MHVQDLSQNRRIARLAQLTRELEQSRTPEDTLRIIERGFAEVDGFVASLLLSTRDLSPGHYRVVDAHLKDEPLSDLHSPGEGGARSRATRGILGAIISRREPQLRTRRGLGSRPVLLRDAPRVYVGHGDPAYRRPSAHDMGDWAEEAPETIHRIGPGGDRRAGGGLAHCWRTRSSPANWRAPTSRLTATPGGWANSSGRCSRHLCHGSPDWKSRRVTSHWAGQAATSTTYSLSTSARTAEPMPTRPRAAGASSSVMSKDTAWRPRLVMAIVQAVLHVHPAGIATPAGLMMYGNRQLCSSRIGGLVTAFLGIYEPASRRLTYASGRPSAPLAEAGGGRGDLHAGCRRELPAWN